MAILWYIAATMTFNLTLVLCDNMLVSSTTLAAEIFQFAEAMARASRAPHTKLNLRWVSIDGKPVMTSAGFRLTPTHSIDDSFTSDLIHIPALWRNPRPAVMKNLACIPWLQEQHQRNSSFTAVGTGVCFLAEAGLLDDKPATTHWHYFDQLQRSYPKVKLARQHFTTQAGNIFCAASINAMAELIMHQVERIFGHVIARQAQRNFFHEIRNLTEPLNLGDQHKTHSDEAIVQAQMWIQDNLSKQLTVPELAAQFGMSTRTFNRRFVAAVAMTPGDYLTDVRMTFACDLLKNTDLTILGIAGYSGYNDASWFSSRFKHWSGNSPKEYRNTVRGKLFSTEMT
ncbi:helix-turn-helix domain-containing protein [SAR92 clade bacterium H455]|uniref:Helix-turn-helix domain-containing protein n=1 Tax=SAR92 clade bacterium H455 TaxID=2974818 RepID=A0ABY5TPN6_9GAMM|nr:helix-turn-helix domain-containing protein [SAR92 clade bacterium H455]